MKQDKQHKRDAQGQLRSPSKQDMPTAKHLPPSDMGKRAKGGDKFASNHSSLPRPMKGSDHTSVSRKSR
jgi:hypothetical protein